MADATPLAKKPRFRAEHVGSLLRPATVRRAREDRASGRIDAEDLAHVEDEAVAGLVVMQQDIGIPAVTDGEVRRARRHLDFMGALTGFDLVERGGGDAFHGAALRPVHPVIRERVDFPEDHPMLAHFRHLAGVARATPKIAIPGPSCCHFRVDRADVAPPEYADDEVLFHDLAQAYRKAIQAFYVAGCRYLQFDDIFLADLCEPEIRAEKAALGWDCDRIIGRYAWMVNEAIKDRPADMTVAMHLRRGAFQSSWAASGGYDPAAEAIFSTDIDVWFMEYDSDRAGGFEPLRLLPEGDGRVMVGLISTRAATLEKLDDIKRSIDAAAKFADLGQLGVAPQCGFAATDEGKLITEDDQKRKLDLVVRAAEAIWGSVEG